MAFYIYNSATNAAVSEEYRVEVGASGLLEDLAMIGLTKAIFTVWAFYIEITLTF